MGVLHRTSKLVPATALSVAQRYQVHCQSQDITLRNAQIDPAIFEYNYSLRSLTGLDFGLTRMDFND